MRHLVTLISNGDLTQHPKNSLTHFTNSFPEPFHPKKRLLFRVRLRYIALSNVLKSRAAFDPRYPSRFDGVVRVSLGEVEPQRSNSGRDTCLGSFSFENAEAHGGYSFYEFLHAPFLPVTETPVTSLTVFITNSLGEQLPLRGSYPTFVTLELSDEAEMEQFQVTCYSHLLSPTAQPLFPENTLSKFTVNLPTELELYGRWEVALSNITFPDRMRDKLFYIRIEKQTLYYDARRARTAEDLMQDIVQRWDAFGYSNQVDVRIVHNKKTRRYVSLQFVYPEKDEEGRKSPGGGGGLVAKESEVEEELDDPEEAEKVEAVDDGDDGGEEEEGEEASGSSGGVRKDSDDDENVLEIVSQFTIPPELARDNHRLNRLAHNRKQVISSSRLECEISPAIMNVFGYVRKRKPFRFILEEGEVKRIKRTQKRVSLFERIRPTPLSMLYCNIVMPSIIANVKGSLLQVIPIEDFMLQERVVHYVPRRLLFQRLIPHKIKSIDFELTQTDGSANSLICDHEQDSIIVTLLFRRRSKK